MTSVTWLHLSDWHQRQSDFDRNFVRDKLLPDIKQCQQEYPELADIDMVFFTGEWLAEFDRHEVETELYGVSDFVLRGHEHSNKVEVVMSTGGSGVIIRGGSCYNGLLPERPLYSNAYNFVHFDLETRMGVVFFRKWSDTAQKWIPDHEKVTQGRFPFVLPTASIAPSNSRSVSDTETFLKSEDPSVNVSGAIGVDLFAKRQTYLDYVCRRWENLEMRGISRTSKTEAIRLDEVYVSLTVEREAVQNRLPADWRDSDHAVKDEEARKQARIGREEDPLPVPSRFGVTSERRVERIGLPEALRENRCLVVLGDPGAGKTTLARFLARRFALACGEGSERVLAPVLELPTLEKPIPAVLSNDDYGAARLPLLLRVADFAEALRKNGNLRLRDFLYYARGDAEISDTEAVALFEDALMQGQALLILDGLDEVARTADRSKIARRINDFVASIDARNRIVVTSRIAGYPAARLDGHFLPVTMQDMEFVQIERFVNSRVTAYERAQTPDAGLRELLRRGRSEIEAILEAVQRNEGVKRLAVNPLLLTILCLIHRTGARLPERRIELYEAVSQTLLVEWRPANAEHDNSTVPISEADRLLAPLAHWMHEHTPRGLIAEEKAKDLLLDYCAARHRLPKDHPTVEREIADFWHRLTYETSVFVERNTKEYAFLHLTFEEYWAARYLVRDTMQAAERLRAVRDNPRFREVIRLAVASRSEEDAAHLIRSAIWCPSEESPKYGYTPSPYEDILLTDLLLCVECLGDCATIETLLARAVAGKLVALCLPSDALYSVSSRLERVYTMLSLLRHRDIGAEAIPVLLKALQDEDRSVRSAAAGALGNAAAGSPDAVQALLKALQDEGINVRSAAWKSLCTLLRG